MGRYKLINWQTLPFKKKSFKGQAERYIKCCIVGVDEPWKILDYIYIFGFGMELIDIVSKYESGIEREQWENVLEKPIDGEFVEIKSLHGPLYHKYTRDEGLYGLCTQENVGKAERDIHGKVKVYHNMKVFSYYIYDEAGNKHYVNGWRPEQMYNRYFGYRYIPLSDLTEPLQLGK